jgi:hypothetical protein
MFLNRGFEELLRRKLERFADEILTPYCLEEAFSMFDTRLKCQFNPLAHDCESSFRIPLPGARNIFHVGLEGGFLKLSKYAPLLDIHRRNEVETIFKPVFSEILGLVKEQIRNVRQKDDRGIKVTFQLSDLTIDGFPCGWLGIKSVSCGLSWEGNLEKHRRTATPLWVRALDLNLTDTSMSAITRGAVLYKLGLNLVKEHVMRVHYGVATWVPLEGHHPRGLRIRSNDGKPVCKDVMLWFANKVLYNPHSDRTQV